jgi:hypothetical protein
MVSSGCLLILDTWGLFSRASTRDCSRVLASKRQCSLYFRSERVRTIARVRSAEQASDPLLICRGSVKPFICLLDYDYVSHIVLYMVNFVILYHTIILIDKIFNKKMSVYHSSKLNYFYMSKNLDNVFDGLEKLKSFRFWTFLLIKPSVIKHNSYKTFSKSQLTHFYLTGLSSVSADMQYICLTGISVEAVNDRL